MRRDGGSLLRLTEVHNLQEYKLKERKNIINEIVLSVHSEGRRILKGEQFGIFLLQKGLFTLFRGILNNNCSHQYYKCYSCKVYVTQFSLIFTTGVIIIGGHSK